MSQWNNSYAYNNQYQGPNGWNGDPNGQYMNQAYYPRPDANGQYVSFNEFLTQMQNSNGAQTVNSNAYNNLSYENYTPNQYNYQNTPSSSQTQLNNYNFGASSSLHSEVNSHPVASQSQFSAQTEQNDYKNNMAFKSNLTATALEFVPKSSAPKPSTDSQNIPEASSSNSEMKEKANEPRGTEGSLSDRNWRTKHQSSKQANDVKDKPSPSEHPQDNQKSNERKGRHRDQRSNETSRHGNRAQDHNEDRESNSHNELNSRKQEPNKRSQEPRHRNNDSHNRNQESRQQTYDSNDRNQDSRPRNYELNRNESRQKNCDSTSRNQDTRHHLNNDSSDRNLESSDPSNRNDHRNQSKGSAKTKNKDDNRTFYNSNISKDSQDVRRGDGTSRSEALGRGESSGRVEGSTRGENSGRGQRNWAGTQRTRHDQNQDDGQYANNYYQREDRERDRPDRVERDRPERYQRDEKDRPERVERDRQDRYQREERDRYRPERGERDRQERYQREDRDRDRPERVQKYNPASPARFKSKHQTDIANKEMTQRERLTDQLDKGTLECLVCCDRVRQIDPVWSCSNCYHVLHLRCIRKWALSSVVEGKWRCPACQNTSSAVPTEYRCMCGAMRSPEYQRGSGAHTCGGACQRARVCPHPCTLLCHPGPCPPCQATVTKHCGCGAETRSVTCSSKLPQVCGRTCGRKLACLVHTCDKECHEGDCEECDKTVTQVCYCSAATKRTVPCTKESGTMQHWECDRECVRVLSCGAHVCRATCHPPPCATCALLPDAVPTCPCGKLMLEKNARKSCTDPIPLCGNICAKPLACGPAGDKHFCKLLCHQDGCPTCPDTTLVQCRCGHSSRDIPCAELPEMIDNVFCQKKCNKKLSCGRHRCRTACCASGQHRCTAPCVRLLSCGLHRCEQHCHTGHCAPCTRVSFSELRCECGAVVILPPVPCGARPPVCVRPCPRPRPCGHAPHHSCHSGECPPCVVLTAKRCYGGHEERKTIPCSLEEFSCGLLCGKPLPCGKHSCIKTCHKGPCSTDKCTQPCTEKRPSCGHACQAPCHSSATKNTSGALCPSTGACKQPVRATCPCGRRRADRTCGDNARDHARMMSALAATKMQEGGAIEISEVQRPGNVLKTLECDDECRVEARTRQMALALQIRNPDVSAKLAPRYSDHVRTTAVREPAFAQQIHDKLTELVQLAKKSKQKTRAHSFPSMNWQKRQFIHELCEHFGCESIAYDAEPNRNVVATADKEKSWLPAMSILEVLAREAGKRRVPGPMLRDPPASLAAPASAHNTNKSSSGWATLTSKSTNAWASRGAPKQTPPEAKIDYFDNPPDN